MVGSTSDTLPDEAEVDVARRGRDQVGVLAGHPHRQRAVHVDGRDDVAVDLADEHHPRDVERVGVGDAQPVAELGLLAQPRHELADLRSAAVHHDGQDPDGAHEHDVLGERGQGVGLAPGVAVRGAQRVAAVLDDDDLARRSGGCTAAPRRGPRPSWPPPPSAPASPWAGSPRRARPARRSRRRPVLVDVAVAEVGAQHDGRGRSRARGRSRSRRGARPGGWPRPPRRAARRSRRRTPRCPRRPPTRGRCRRACRPSRARRRCGPSRGPHRTASTARAWSPPPCAAAVCAASSLGAPRTATCATLVAPSASSTICSASDGTGLGQRRGRARPASASPRGRWPARARCRWSTCSRRR